MVTRSRAPVVTKNWLQGDLKPEPQNQLELKVNASIQWITTVNASIEFKRYIYIYIYIFLLYGDWQFSLFLLWKWNNNSSETKQCEESLRKTAKTRLFREKGTLKNKLTHSKRFDHVIYDVMSLFWSWNKLSGKTLLYRKFSLPSDKGLTLYSPRPSLPTFSLMLITPPHN